MSTLLSESRKRTSATIEFQDACSMLVKKLTPVGVVLAPKPSFLKVRHSKIAFGQGVQFSSQDVEISVYYLAVQFLLTHGSQNGLLYLENGVLNKRSEAVGEGNMWSKNTNKSCS